VCERKYSRLLALLHSRTAAEELLYFSTLPSVVETNCRRLAPSLNVLPTNKLQTTVKMNGRRRQRLLCSLQCSFFAVLGTRSPCYGHEHLTWSPQYCATVCLRSACDMVLCCVVLSLMLFYRRAASWSLKSPKVPF